MSAPNPLDELVRLFAEIAVRDFITESEAQQRADKCNPAVENMVRNHER